jgi:hypothetical protein
VFLHLLKESEKAIFAEAADHLIEADQVLHELEIELRNSLAKEMAITWPVAEDRDWDRLRRNLSNIESDVSRRVILLELCGVAFADRDLDTNERDLLADVCSALDLPEEELEPCLEFSSRAHLMYAEGQHLVLGVSARM